jgi:hypothetical protein
MLIKKAVNRLKVRSTETNAELYKSKIQLIIKLYVLWWHTPAIPPTQMSTWIRFEDSLAKKNPQIQE